MSTCDHKSLLPDNSTPLELEIEKLLYQKYCNNDLSIIQKLFNPWDCPVNFLPYLAEAESVDIWDDDWSEYTKRKVIADAPEVHRHKGFYPAVAKAIKSLGIESAQIIDWLEDEENIPLGCFRVEINANEESINSNKKQQMLRRFIDRVKRLSAHYELISYDQATINANTQLTGVGVLNGGFKSLDIKRDAFIKSTNNIALKAHLQQDHLPPTAIKLQSKSATGLLSINQDTTPTTRPIISIVSHDIELIYIIDDHDIETNAVIDAREIAGLISVVHDQQNIELKVQGKIKAPIGISLISQIHSGNQSQFMQIKQKYQLPFLSVVYERGQ